MDRILKFFQKFRTTFMGLSTPHKILSSGALLVFLASLGYLIYSSNRPDYTTLYSGLAQTDMAEVVQTLKEKKIPYQLTNNTIEVPKEHLYETRLSLASQGIPKGSGIGFEVFDQQKLGSTEFVQKINYQRALQGELARTINEMEEVLESRVHLVLPEESLFQEDQKPPSAAVVLKLKPSAKLDQRHVQGIVHLVSSAIRGLDEDKVTIMSTDGQVLFKKGTSDDPLQMTTTQHEYKNRLEEDMRQKVQTMLGQVLGVNRVLTRVAMDVDFNRVQIAEETYDPDSSVVRSQQRSVENMDGSKASSPGGNPDVPINVESKLLQNPTDSEPQKASGGKQMNRQRETVNYEINKVNRQIVQTPGSVKKISVAVIVDGPYEMKPDGNGKEKSTFVGRSPDELKSLEDIVRKAVGYSEARGDQITVSNIPFVADIEDGGATSPENRWVQMLKNNQKILFNLLLTFLIFFFIVRPFMKKFQKLGEESPEGTPEALPAPETQEAAGLLESTPLRELPLRKRIAIMVQQDPQRATEIIRGWLKEE